ncbi:MOSC domain-containing protein, partial [Pseudomonas aeruginosa]
MSEERVKWIGVRSGRRAPIQELEAVAARRGLGVTGDLPH